jgi:hypothetical protein
MDREGEHSSDKESVCCQFMFGWVVSVVVVLRYIPMSRWDWYPGDCQVQEVDTIVVFMS